MPIILIEKSFIRSKKMHKANKYSLSGIGIAFLAIALFCGNNFISAAIASFNLAGLPRELRLGIDAGLISQDQCNRQYLNRNSSRQAFADRLGILLEQVGLIEVSDRKSLEKAGIFSCAGSTLSRKEAVESMARICLLLAGKEQIKLPEEKAVNYRDFRIAEKYSQAIAFLQKRFVVRGYPDGHLGASKKLSNRESVYFLYRLYETIAAEMMAKQPAAGIRFVDISLNHPVMNSIRTLTQAGAFNKLMLKPAFDGEAHILTRELSEMIEGILENNQQEIDQVRLKTILPGNASLTRSQLAMALEYLLTGAELPEPKEKISYIDVKADSAEFAALTRLAAAEIRLGYQTNYFRGQEKVTWFEAVSAVATAIKSSLKIAPASKNTQTEKLAQKEDIDALIALIKAKKARVRQILEYKRPYQR